MMLVWQQVREKEPANKKLPQQLNQRCGRKSATNCNSNEVILGRFLTAADSSRDNAELSPTPACRKAKSAPPQGILSTAFGRTNQRSKICQGRWKPAMPTSVPQIPVPADCGFRCLVVISYYQHVSF